MWHKPHQKFDFLNWDGQLALSDYVLVDISIDLYDLSLFVFARGEIITLLIVLSNAKKCVLVNIVAEFGLFWFYHCQV